MDWDKQKGPVLTEPTIRLCFFSEDSRLASFIGQTLGEGFATRTGSIRELPHMPEVRSSFDVVLLDLRFAATNGDPDAALQSIDEIVKFPSHAPVIVLVDSDDRRLLLEAMNRGAYDGVFAPPNIAELRLVLRRASKFHETLIELDKLRADSRGSGHLLGLRGTSSAMQELFALAKKIGPCDVSVLITGETGTGKELLARAIHQMSARSARPLVAFSCANLPESLVEDELFGHEKGAFTGAITSRCGRFEAANHGTLFLDEIGDLGLGLQPKLLRVLQERSLQRLGSNATIHVNIRQICATHRNLAEMVEQGKFREDLYYRLNVVQMHLPPLRERRDDIPLLAQFFLEGFAQQFNKKARRFSLAAMHALEEHPWPGNVRELENAVQRAVALSDGPTLDAWSFPAVLRRDPPSPQMVASYNQEVREFKKRLVLRTLRECGWQKAESARTLGMARGYLHRLINQLGIEEAHDDAPLAAQATGSLRPIKSVASMARGGPVVAD